MPSSAVQTFTDPDDYSAAIRATRAELTVTGPLRHPSAPGLSLTGVRLIIPDHASGFPVLRALSLCTCCRHYPGAAAGRSLRSCHPTVSAFPGSTSGSACTSSFSRFAQRSLALRPAHSRGHQSRDRYPKASDISSPPCLLRLLPAGAVAGRGLHPLDKRRLVTAHVESRPSRQGLACTADHLVRGVHELLAM